MKVTLRLPLLTYRALMLVVRREGGSLSALVRSFIRPHILDQLKELEAQLKK